MLTQAGRKLAKLWERNHLNGSSIVKMGTRLKCGVLPKEC